MSRQHRVGRFDGVERANSLTWNPHKVRSIKLWNRKTTYTLKLEYQIVRLIVNKTIFQFTKTNFYLLVKLFTLLDIMITLYSVFSEHTRLIKCRPYIPQCF